MVNGRRCRCVLIQGPAPVRQRGLPWNRGAWSTSHVSALYVGPSAFERLLHASFLVALCAFVVAQPYIRDRGGLVFWAFTVVATVYAGLSVRPFMMRALLGFNVVGLAYVGLSYLDVLPDAWTTVYDPALIPRQAFYVVLLYPFILAAYSMWSYAVARGRLGRTLVWLFVSAGLLGPLARFLAGDEATLLEAYASATTGGFGNARLLFFMAWTYFLLVRVRNVEMGRVFALFVVAGFFLSYFEFVREPQLQNMIGLGVFLVIAFSRARRRTVVALALGAVALYAALIPFADRVYEIDKNTGYRLVLTQDALQGLVGSYFLGVGFGKEVVTGDYDLAGVRQVRNATSPSDLAVQGVHNSFAQELMRLGILGGGYVIWLFFGIALPPSAGPTRVRRHLSVVYLVLLITMMANVSLESPTYIVGVAFGLGYLLVLRDARAVEARGRPGGWSS